MIMSYDLLRLYWRYDSSPLSGHSLAFRACFSARRNTYFRKAVVILCLGTGWVIQCWMDVVLYQVILLLEISYPYYPSWPTQLLFCEVSRITSYHPQTCYHWVQKNRRSQVLSIAPAYTRSVVDATVRARLRRRASNSCLRASRPAFALPTHRPLRVLL